MPKLRTFRAFEFSVRGAGSFPTDMLRYDRAVPYSSEDVGGMGSVIEGASVRLPRTVRLIAYAPAGYKLGPCVDRWASFGWQVVPGSVKPLYE